MLRLRSIPEENAPGDVDALFGLLKGPLYAKEVAKNKFGFRAYERLSQLRTIAINKPAAYLRAKTIRMMGGDAPRVGNNPGDLSGKEIKLLYGTLPEAPVKGVADDVAEIYANTLTQLYDAGADEKTADQYASAVAQALLQSKAAVLESEFPDFISETGERNLVLNQLGTVGGRIAMTAPKIKSITHK